MTFSGTPTGRSDRDGTAGVIPLRMVLVIGSLFILTVSSGEAQGGRSSDNVLYPQPDPLPILAGPEVGYGRWDNKGHFSVADGNRSCTSFDNGTGKGMTIGVKSFIYLTPWFFLSPRIRYEARSGSFITPLAGEPVRDASDKVVPLDQEAQVDATIAAVSFDATIGLEFYSVYLFGGGAMGLPLDGSYNYTERMKGASSGFTYVDSRTNEHQLVSGRPFATYQKSTFDLRGGIGYMLHIGSFVIAPEAFYSYPLTSVLGSPDELKQTGMVGTIGILYSIR